MFSSNAQARRFLMSQRRKEQVNSAISAANKEALTDEMFPPPFDITAQRWEAMKKAVTQLGASASRTLIGE